MVKHILADGTRPADITGHIVRETDAERVYKIMEGLEDEKKDTEHDL